MKKLGLLAAAFSIGCSAAPKSTPTPVPQPKPKPILEAVVQDLSTSTIVDQHDANSSSVVVIIADHHTKATCQVQNYKTLASVRERTRFVGAEGFEGTITAGKIDNPECLAYTMVDAGARKTIEGHILKDPTMVPVVESALGPRPMPSPYLQECLRSKTVTHGIDSDALLRKSYGLFLEFQGYRSQIRELMKQPQSAQRDEQLEKVFEKHEATKTEFEDILYRQRDDAFARNTLAYAQKRTDLKGDTIPIQIGSAHSKEVAQRIKDAGVSYVIVWNDECNRK